VLLSSMAGLCLLAVACRPGDGAADAPADAAKVRVENAELGVAIANLNPFFKVVSNEGAEIVLEPAPDTAGRLIIKAVPSPTQNVNLVAAVEAHKADLEARANGSFRGQRELGGPLGVAYYSRGQFDGADGARQEETAIFTIHPNGAEILALVYGYPVGDDTQARLEDQLFDVFGEVEPFTAAGAGDAGADDGSAAASPDAAEGDAVEGDGA
jgi:hypothetical protein